MLCFTHRVWKMWGKDSEVWSPHLQHYLLMLKDVCDTIKLKFSEQWCVWKEVNPSVASVAQGVLVYVGGRVGGGSKVLLTCLELQKDFSQEEDLLGVKGTVKPKKVGCWRLCHERQYFTAEVKCVFLPLTHAHVVSTVLSPFPLAAWLGDSERGQKDDGADKTSQGQSDFSDLGGEGRVTVSYDSSKGIRCCRTGWCSGTWLAF